MDLINFIKNLFKQKENDLWVYPKNNLKSHSTTAKCDNDILEVNTLTGEVIIKRNTKEHYPENYWFLENK